MIQLDEAADWFSELQDRLCQMLEGLDGVSEFGLDDWQRPGGGGGVTRILAGDGPLEKAAVNVSKVWGDAGSVTSDSRAAQSNRFAATGISMIVHPRNPHAPIFHANLRYFETSGGGSWFGGGADLTPHYLYEEDAVAFHRGLRAVCMRHEIADYTAWKDSCDNYFSLPHRGEARGIGGVFFDHLGDRLDAVWSFIQDLGRELGLLYLSILERRIHTPYGDREELWQLRRRGRYAEFNLIWDRGTRFGLETGGRTESILASLPPRVRWDYGVRPQAGSEEARLETLLRGRPRNWVEG